MQDLLATCRGAQPPMRAAEIIGRRIVSGGLLPGATLPDSNQLAAELSVSRLSVRAAVKMLAAKGLVAPEPRHGNVVLPRSEWSRGDLDVLVWQIAGEPDAAFVGNLFEARRIIEPDAAAIVAERGNPEAIAAIGRALAAMTAADPQSPQSMAADLAFHRSLLTGTGNEFIAGLAPLFETLLAAVLHIQRRARPPSVALVPDHQAVLAAIKRGDAVGARQAAAVLLDGAERDAMDGLALPALAGDGAAARSMSQ